MENCYYCNKIFTNNCSVLKCGYCQKVVHATTLCSGLSTEQLTALKAAENLEWRCNDCNQRNKEKHKEVKMTGANIDVEKLMQDLRKEVTSIVTEEMQSVSASVQCCSEKVDEFSESIVLLTGKVKDIDRKVDQVDNHNKDLELKIESLVQHNNVAEQQPLVDLVETTDKSGLPGPTQVITSPPQSMGPQQAPPPVVGVNVVPAVGGSLVLTVQMGPNPSRVVCKSCNQEIVTKTKPKASMRTHLIAAIFCVTLLWPCVCIPYCTNSCRNTEHYCPHCDAYIGSHIN